jgi:hypothetical protein
MTVKTVKVRNDSFFPILIQTEEGALLVNCPSDIPSGVAFKVLTTKYNEKGEHKDV